jgi:hypothetical protein
MTQFTTNPKIAKKFEEAHKRAGSYPDPDVGYDILTDTAVAAVIPVDDREVWFQVGVEIGQRFPDTDIIYYHNSKAAGATYYFVGEVDDIIDDLNGVFDCFCSNDTLTQSGCQCGGN